MIKLDYSQHKCPYPVVETRKQMLANPEQVLEVLVGDQAGRDNVSRLAAKMGYQASAEPATEGYLVRLTPSEQTQQTTSTTNPTPSPVGSGKTVIYCGSDRMGDGDDAFGLLLLKNFLTTLLEMDPLPDNILFVNSGINLTTKGSDMIEVLEKLVQRGVDIASCGLCLDYYNKKEDLLVGRTTNMYEMAELQCQATRVVTP
jgi:selenium metabolism protein YedF